MTLRAHLFVAGLLLSTLFALAACTSDASPTVTQTVAPTVTATSLPTPSEEPMGIQYPVTVTDMLGRSVEIAQSPLRIVSISPTATEMLYRIGGAAVGRDTSSGYPPEAQDVATVGGAYSPSVEVIVALEPDLILIEALSQGHLVASLGNAGAPVLAVRAASLEDVEQGLALLGTVVDLEEAATQASTEIRDRVQTVADSLTTSQSVLILISDADRNVYAAKPESYPGAIVALLGLTNVAEGMQDSGPFPGFALFSAELALSSEPDFIFAISPAPEPAPRLSTVLPMVPGYGDLTAVQGGRLKELSPDLFLMAPGPRIADAIEEISRLLDESYQGESYE
jgi:iron complex transport system substrate-binding protein